MAFPIASAVVVFGIIFTLVLPALSDANVTIQDAVETPRDLVFDSLSPATASVIFLHGFSATPENTSALLSPTVAAFQSSGFAHVRFIAPFGSLLAADERDLGLPGPPVTEGQSWFTFSGNASVPGCQLPKGELCTFVSCPLCVPGGGPDISSAVDRIDALISAEVARGIPSERVLLIGISQGGALASKVLAESPVALGGTLSLVGWLPDGSSFVVPEGRTTVGGGGVRFVAGSVDKVVQMFWVTDGIAVLEQAGIAVELRVIEGMGHTLSGELFVEVGTFLKTKVPGADIEVDAEPSSEEMNTKYVNYGY